MSFNTSRSRTITAHPAPATASAPRAAQSRPASTGQNAASGSAQVEECLAVAALAMEDWAALARHCDRLSREQPDRFDVWLNLTAASLQEGNSEAAVEAGRQALRLRPTSADAQLNLAFALHQADEAEEAIGHYRQAIQLGCSSQAANWNLALLEGEAGNADVAVEMLTAFKAPDAEWGRDVQVEKGALLLALNRPGEAVPYLEASAGHGAITDWEARFNLGVAQLRSGQPARALDTLESVREEVPEEIDVLWAVATAATAAGDGKRLSSVRRTLREKGETVTELTFNLGLHLEEKGRDTDALRAYSEALKERPLFAEALANLAHVLNRLGQAEQSADCWQRAVALKPELAA